MQHAHAVANYLEREHLAVVAVQRFANQHRRLDFKDVVARMVGHKFENHAFLGRIVVQHHGLGVDHAAIAQKRHLNHAAAEAALPDDRLQLHRRAHEGEIVGKHGGHRQIAQLFFADEHGVHGCGQRFERLARVGVQRSAADASGVDAVGEEHHGAEISAAKTGVQLG